MALFAWILRHLPQPRKASANIDHSDTRRGIYAFFLSMNGTFCFSTAQWLNETSWNAIKCDKETLCNNYLWEVSLIN